MGFQITTPAWSISWLTPHLLASVPQSGAMAPSNPPAAFAMAGFQELTRMPTGPSLSGLWASGSSGSNSKTDGSGLDLLIQAIRDMRGADQVDRLYEIREKVAAALPSKLPNVRALKVAVELGQRSRAIEALQQIATTPLLLRCVKGRVSEAEIREAIAASLSPRTEISPEAKPAAEQMPDPKPEKPQAAPVTSYPKTHEPRPDLKAIKKLERQAFAALSKELMDLVRSAPLSDGQVERAEFLLKSVGGLRFGGGIVRQQDVRSFMSRGIAFLTLCGNRHLADAATEALIWALQHGAHFHAVQAARLGLESLIEIAEEPLAERALKALASSGMKVRCDGLKTTIASIGNIVREYPQLVSMQHLERLETVMERTASPKAHYEVIRLMRQIREVSVFPDQRRFSRFLLTHDMNAAHRLQNMEWVLEHDREGMTGEDVRNFFSEVMAEGKSWLRRRARDFMEELIRRGTKEVAESARTAVSQLYACY